MSYQAMTVKLYNGGTLKHTIPDITRAETTYVTRDGQQYKVFLLDAEDSLDMVVHYPNGNNEIVWSIVKDTDEIEKDE
jgi:hypothetical protein